MRERCHAIRRRTAFPSPSAVRIVTEPDATCAEWLRGGYQRRFAPIPSERAEAPAGGAVSRWGGRTCATLQTPYME
jgi:hypothetical protein